MNKILSCSRFVLPVLSSIVLTGCLLRTATVSPRHFFLTPIPVDKSSTVSSSHLSVEIGSVKMPAYLLRDSIAVRTGPNEIEYLENALWAERLDKSFQRALVANLSQLLPSAEIQPADFRPRDRAAEQITYRDLSPVGLPEDKRSVRIQVSIEWFDVDARGHGQLIANWRITDPEINSLLKTGRTTITRAEGLTRGDPEAVAKNMSTLTAKFSGELARSVSRAVIARTVSGPEWMAPENE